MTNPVVTINVSVEAAPAPVTLQRTGAFISQGGTTLAPQSTLLLTQLSDLTPHLTTALTITSMLWSSGTVTVTTATPHGWTNGDVIPVVIAAVVPTGYNGEVQATVTGASTFTFPLASSPGAVTTQGTAILADEAELLSMATTFFAQGSGLSVYVLELGEGTPAEGVTALTTWINTNEGTQKFYSYLVPREWDGVTQYITFLGNYKTTTSKRYFYTTTTTENYTSYSGIKSVFWLVEAPGIPSTEFSLAAAFWDSLNPNPSTTNPVGQLAYTYEYGVTAWPTAGNTTTLSAILSAGGSYMGQGPQGGASNVVLMGGTMADSNPWKYWYSIDWAQITLQYQLWLAVVNGSNSLPPLLYNQAGINALQVTAVSVYKTGLAAGLCTGTLIPTQLDSTTWLANLQAGSYAQGLVVNADPWASYTAANPGNYQTGVYGGLSGTWLPLPGFSAITFNLNVVTA